MAGLVLATGKDDPHGVRTEQRFAAGEATVADRLTGLTWTRNANPFVYTLSWLEALQAVAGMNREGRYGCSSWRLPNRSELRSLIDHGCRKPALPADHPFENVFLAWRWSSTTSAMAPAYAWALHLEGGRLFYGRKNQEYLVWPVCGTSHRLARTGQLLCYDAAGGAISCNGTGQDGALRQGRAWPSPRFVCQDKAVLDLLTGLEWTRTMDLAGGPLTWSQALDLVDRFNESGEAGGGWRLPTINELESLIDASVCNPALPAGHPFVHWREAYWSATESGFDRAWAFCLYLHKGAVGVGHKQVPEFHCWAVRRPGFSPFLA